MASGDEAEAVEDTLPSRDAIPHPSAIKINVEGAFIVDEDNESPQVELEDSDGVEYKHDTKDIRLPNHTSVVSHVAVDVRESSLDIC